MGATVETELNVYLVSDGRTIDQRFTKAELMAARQFMDLNAKKDHSKSVGGMTSRRHRKAFPRPQNYDGVWRHSKAYAVYHTNQEIQIARIK